jgi:hypothetical protein
MLMAFPSVGLYTHTRTGINHRPVSVPIPNAKINEELLSQIRFLYMAITSNTMRL